MRYPYANTYLIRSGAQRFSFAAMEMRQSAQKIESLTYSVHDGANGWQGAGYEAFQSVAGHLKGDTLTASHALEQVASALSSLAGSYDSINRMYQQVEQMDQEIHSLEGQLYYADEERRDALRDSLSHVRYRRRALLQEAEMEEHRANARAASAFDEAGAMANRMYFDAGTVLAMQATQAARQVKEFFGDLKDKAGQVFRQVLPEEFRDFAEGFASRFLYNQSMELADPLHEPFPEGRSKSYQMGLLSADVFTALEGIALIFGGGALVVGGSAEAVITSETIVLPAIGVAAVAAGGTVSGIGYKQYENATKQLGKDWALFAKSGSGNGASSPSQKPSSSSSGASAGQSAGQSAVDVQKILQEYRNLQNTQSFRPSAIKHIMEGDLNAHGFVGGYHYENIPNTPGRTLPGTESTPNPFGVYRAKVEVNGIQKVANGGRSTFFPKDMSPQEIVDAINEAYAMKAFMRGNSYEGIVQTGPKAGMKINIFLDANGKIISAFPVR